MVSLTLCAKLNRQARTSIFVCLAGDGSKVWEKNLCNLEYKASMGVNVSLLFATSSG